MALVRSRVPSRRASVAVLVAVVALVTVVLAVIRGAESAAGAGFGGVAGLVFVLSGPWLLEPVVRRSPAAALPAAVGLYTVKAVAAIVLLAAVVEVDSVGRRLDPAGIAAALVAVAVVWTGLQIWGWQRGRVPTYDLDDSPS